MGIWDDVVNVVDQIPDDLKRAVRSGAASAKDIADFLVTHPTIGQQAVALSQKAADLGTSLANSGLHTAGVNADVPNPLNALINHAPDAAHTILDRPGELVRQGIGSAQGNLAMLVQGLPGESIIPGEGATQIANIYRNGFNGYTGGRAVWEQMVNTEPFYENALLTLGTDPYTYATLGAGGAAKGLTEEAAQYGLREAGTSAAEEFMRKGAVGLTRKEVEARLAEGAANLSKNPAERLAAAVASGGPGLTEAETAARGAAIADRMNPMEKLLRFGNPAEKALGLATAPWEVPNELIGKPLGAIFREVTNNTRAGRWLASPAPKTIVNDIFNRVVDAEQRDLAAPAAKDMGAKIAAVTPRVEQEIISGSAGNVVRDAFNAGTAAAARLKGRVFGGANVPSGAAGIVENAPTSGIIDLANPQDVADVATVATKRMLADPLVNVGAATLSLSRDASASGFAPSLSKESFLANMADYGIGHLSDVEKDALWHESLAVAEKHFQNAVASGFTPKTMDEFVKLVRGGAVGKDYYDASAQALDAIFGKGNGQDKQLFAALVAATSPANEADKNIATAIKFYTFLKADWRQALIDNGFDDTFVKRVEDTQLMSDTVDYRKLPSGLKSHVVNAERVAAGEPIQGQKVEAFLNQLLGRPSENVAIDRHIANAVFGDKTPNVSQFAYANGLIKALANSPQIKRELGGSATPSEVQAAIWTAMKGGVATPWQQEAASQFGHVPVRESVQTKANEIVARWTESANAALNADHATALDSNMKSVGFGSGYRRGGTARGVLFRQTGDISTGDVVAARMMMQDAIGAADERAASFRMHIRPNDDGTKTLEILYRPKGTWKNEDAYDAVHRASSRYLSTHASPIDQAQHMAEGVKLLDDAIANPSLHFANPKLMKIIWGSGQAPKAARHVTPNDVTELMGVRNANMSRAEEKLVYDSRFQHGDLANQTYHQVYREGYNRLTETKKMLDGLGITWDAGDARDVKKVVRIIEDKVPLAERSNPQYKRMLANVKEAIKDRIDPLHDNILDSTNHVFYRKLNEEAGIPYDGGNKILGAITDFWKATALFSGRYLTNNMTQVYINDVVANGMKTKNMPSLGTMANEMLRNAGIASIADTVFASPFRETLSRFGWTTDPAGRALTPAYMQHGMATMTATRRGAAERVIGGLMGRPVDGVLTRFHGLAEGIDVAGRGALGGNVMETYAEEHLPQMEADVRAMFEKQGLQVPEGFQFFPEGLHKYDPAFLGSYYRGIGFTDGYADRVASDAAEMRKGAAAAAKAAIDKTHFSYEYSNADALVKKVFPFHYWMSRATVLYGESLMRNPFALLVFTKMADELRHTDTDSPGFNARQKFWIRLMSTHHGFNLLMNPDALLGVTHALGMFDGYSPEGETEIGKVRRWMQGAGLTMFPWIDGALNMAGLYGNTFEPDLLGIRHRALVGAAVNALLAEEGKGPGPSPYADLMSSKRAQVSKWVASFAPGWMAQPVPPVQDGNIQSANLDKQIENQVLTNNPGMTYDQLLQVMTDPSSPEYQKAWKTVARMGLASQMLTFTAPTGMKLRQAAPDVRNAGLSLVYKEAAKEGVPADQINPANDAKFATTFKSMTGQDWKPGWYDKNQLDQTIANASPEAKPLLLSESQYAKLPSLFGIEDVVKTYNSIISGNYVPVGYPQHVKLADRGQMANYWLQHQPGPVQQQYQQLREARLAFRQTHPDFDAYKAWQEQVSNMQDTYGPDAMTVYREQVMQGNPAAAKYLNDQIRSIAKKTSDPVKRRSMLDAATMSPDFYLAKTGIGKNYNTPQPGPTSTATSGAYDPTNGQAPQQPQQQQQSQGVAYVNQDGTYNWSNFLTSFGAT